MQLQPAGMQAPLVSALVAGALLLLRALLMCQRPRCGQLLHCLGAAAHHCQTSDQSESLAQQARCQALQQPLIVGVLGCWLPRPAQAVQLQTLMLYPAAAGAAAAAARSALLRC